MKETYRRILPIWHALLVGLILGVGACSDPDEIGSRDRKLVLNPSGDFLDEERQTVFLYFANETDPDDTERRNFEAFIEWSKAIEDPAAAVFIESLEYDLARYGEETREEIVEVKDFFGEEELRGVSAFIVSNRSFLAGHAEIKKPGAGEFVQIPVSADGLSLDGPVQESNPLSTVVGVERVWETVLEVFPPETSNYLWIFRSHGSGLYLVNPKLNLWHEEWTKEELAKALRSGDKIPKTLHQSGITPEQFFALVAALGKERGVRMPLISLEACASEVPPETALAHGEADNVGTIYYTLPEDFVPYRTMDYAKVLGNLRENEMGFPSALAAVIEARQFEPLAPPRRRLRAWMVLAPLAVMLVIAIAVYRDRHEILRREPPVVR